MALFLVVNVTYDAVELGLARDGVLIDSVLKEKQSVSKGLLLTIDHLLASHEYTVADLAAIAVTVGPAPFTSLRIVIATINGIRFATGIPLISLDALQLMLEEHAATDMPTVAFFNAYSDDVYFGIKDGNNPIETGYGNIATVLQDLSQKFGNKKVALIGNGVITFASAVQDQSLVQFVIQEPLVHYVSLPFLAQTTSQKFLQKDTLHDELFPAYLKQLNYKKALV